MMKQFYNKVGDDAEDHTEPGRRNLWWVLLFGVLVPLVIGWYGVESWTTRTAVLWGDDGEDVKLAGDAARAMAGASGGLAVFLLG
ncbi:MAG: hypothetical protein O3A87_07275, partial [Verrucomicrobia bacterium]|nr:hypothetical protein [Verrucomicrobiota bacterium]